MKNAPELAITFVREEKAGIYEYGWISPKGFGNDTLVPVGRAPSREIAHDRAQKLMRMSIVGKKS